MDIYNNPNKDDIAFIENRTGSYGLYSLYISTSNEYSLKFLATGFPRKIWAMVRILAKMLFLVFLISKYT